MSSKPGAAHAAVSRHRCATGYLIIIRLSTTGQAVNDASKSSYPRLLQQATERLPGIGASGNPSCAAAPERSWIEAASSLLRCALRSSASRRRCDGHVATNSCGANECCATFVNLMLRDDDAKVRYKRKTHSAKLTAPTGVLSTKRAEILNQVGDRIGEDDDA